MNALRTTTIWSIGPFTSFCSKLLLLAVFGCLLDMLSCFLLSRVSHASYIHVVHVSSCMQCHAVMPPSSLHTIYVAANRPRVVSTQKALAQASEADEAAGDRDPCGRRV